jgi:dUTP pyrophosphatase
MKKINLKFMLLSKEAKMPSYAHSDDAGFDIYSVESVKIPKGKRFAVKTGLSVEIPNGYFVSFRGKSGLALKFGIDVLGGVVDAGYRGEWMVILANLGEKTYKIGKGDKIAQGILRPCPPVKIVQVKRISSSKRGNKGFGSTGR